jgi:predicted nucleic acid-binding protein
VLVVDSSVWIDFFNARATPERDALRALLAQGAVRIVVPDLVLFEVLRGFRNEREFRQASQLLHELDVEQTLDPQLALEAAGHYRQLRARGVTVRKGVDVLLATFCARHGYLMLHRDRDFDALSTVTGVNAWRH